MLLLYFVMGNFMYIRALQLDRGEPYSIDYVFELFNEQHSKGMLSVLRGLDFSLFK